MERELLNIKISLIDENTEKTTTSLDTLDDYDAKTACKLLIDNEVSFKVIFDHCYYEVKNGEEHK